MKTTGLLLATLLCSALIGNAQCFPAPTPPPCSGSDPQAVPDEIIGSGTSKSFSSTGIFNSLTLQGGTLVVCGNLTIDKFYMDSGTIYIHPGARLVIGSGLGSGIILRGHSNIYNFGTCEIQRNLSMEGGWASAVQPNRIVNALPSSVFRMSSQYLVINNPHSYFVNNGDAEFWGTIQDNQASAGAVCLGNGSETRMAVQINKVANSYTVPTGSACVQVRQFSQFYAPFTAEAGLRACLGSGHYSDSGCTAFGCTPNNWGAASILPACTSCASFAVLEVNFHEFTGQPLPGGKNKLSWKTSSYQQNGRFRLLRSSNGRHYTCIDSLPANSSSNFFTLTDETPLPGANYYMIQYLNPDQINAVNSKSIRLQSSPFQGIHIYPIPFQQHFFIDFDPALQPRYLLLSDMNGRNLKIVWHHFPDQHKIRVQVLEPLQTDVYLLHIQTAQSVMSRTLLHR